MPLPSPDTTPPVTNTYLTHILTSKKREKGYGKLENDKVKITDINSKNLILPIFSLACSKEDYVNLLFEIIADFRNLGYSFEVRGF